MDIVQNKEFWRTAKCLVWLSVQAINLLRVVESDMQGTSKVYQEIFKTEKLLETMSAEYDFIPKVTLDTIHTKWIQLA